MLLVRMLCRCLHLQVVALPTKCPAAGINHGLPNHCAIDCAAGVCHILQVFASLQGRPGLPHDVAITADMRARCPAASLQGAPQQLLQRLGQLKGAVGNFFASAMLEDCEVERWSLGQIAQQLYAAVQR